MCVRIFVLQSTKEVISKVLIEKRDELREVISVCIMYHIYVCMTDIYVQ